MGLITANAAGRRKLPSPFSTQSDSNDLAERNETMRVGRTVQHFLATL